MSVLEARFYPRSKAEASFVVVGRIVCDGARTSIIPVELSTRAVRPFDLEGLYSKLRFLVACASTRPYLELTQMRSDFWAFVDEGAGAGIGSGG